MTRNPRLRDLQWGRDRVAYLLHANVFLADEAFSGPQGNPWQNIDNFLSDAYSELVSAAATDIDPEPFKFYTQVTWKASAQTFTLPTGIDRLNVLFFRDITSSAYSQNGSTLTTAAPPGYTMSPGHIAEMGQPVQWYWSSINELTWSFNGPSQDTILQIGFKAMASPLTEENQEPRLISYQYRDMWPYLAAIRIDPSNALTPAWGGVVAKRQQDWYNAINQVTQTGGYSPVLETEVLF